MINNISGYTGIFKQPIQKPNIYGPTAYYLADEDKKEVLIVILTPESYSDIYNIASSLSIQNVKLFTPSLDVLFISDIFNLFMSLKSIKPNIKWVYPSNPTIETSIEFETAQEKIDYYTHSYDNTINVSYIKDTYNKSRDIYDIIVKDGKRTIYITQYITEEKATELYNDTNISEIHIPYSSTLYGGLDYIGVLNTFPKYWDKFIINSFSSIAEYVYCKQNTKNRIGRLCYNDII